LTPHDSLNSTLYAGPVFGVHFSFLIILLFLSACDQQSTTPSSEENFVNIPDEKFLNALIEAEVDINGDSLISYAEAEANTILSIRYSEISDLTGIESFVKLNTLSVDGNKLTSLDVSNNTALRELNCSHNQITSLEISGSTNLRKLVCPSNRLTNLDVSQNLKLDYLYCEDNRLTNLDVSKNVELTFFVVLQSKWYYFYF
jgi:Leucine-rich repeat (LRR) protein